MIGIGINTGTSADAIDIAIVEFGRSRASSGLKLLWSGTYPYPARLKQVFLELVDHISTFTPSTWFDMTGRFDVALGGAFADAVLKAIPSSGIRKKDIAFIGSHGQTVWHAPMRGKRGTGFLSTGTTIQLGNPSVLAVKTGIPVVAHFRDKDVALGGQGAPLAPVLHGKLFGRYAPAVVVNIGGIANITVLPPPTAPTKIYGFDTGPGNRLIDIAVEAYTDGKRSFDAHGGIAAKGSVDQALLRRLMQDPFVRKRPPKSTGREYYNQTYLTLNGIQSHDINTIATLTAFTAHAVGYNIKHFVRHGINDVIICGGGANNDMIIRHLSGHLPDVAIRTVQDLGYAPNVIEPMLFAYLGYLGFNRIPIHIKSVTGSSSPFVPGGIYYP